MSVWSAASTLIVLSSPAGGTSTLAGSQPVPAVGPGRLLSEQQFEQIWRAFFGEKTSSAGCGSAKDLRRKDIDLIADDSFLVQLRGFRPSMCQSSSWFVASMRVDPCRLRIGTENKNIVDLQKCSLQGKFSEVRFVLQPVEKTDRGPVFPDAALHIAYSITIPDLKKMAAVWRQEKPENLISKTKALGRLNDASLFLGGAGLERWTFARVQFVKGEWLRDKLPHGGFFESISDADLDQGVVRTPRPAQEVKLTMDDFHTPLKISPVQGSCIDCHLADRGRPMRLFRQLGWGLSGEAVISRRVLAEAQAAARELQILENHHE